MKEIAKEIAYLFFWSIMTACANIFAWKLGTAIGYYDKKKKKALAINAVIFIAGFIEGILFMIAYVV